MADLEHLKLIQAVTSRLAGNSFLLKGWAVTLVSGLAALAKVDGNDDVAWISCGVVAVFAVLDGYYLALERAYRKLYEQQAGANPAPGYSLRLPADVSFLDALTALRSPAIWPLYGAAMAGAILVAADLV